MMLKQWKWFLKKWNRKASMIKKNIFYVWKVGGARERRDNGECRDTNRKWLIENCHLWQSSAVKATLLFEHRIRNFCSLRLHRKKFLGCDRRLKNVWRNLHFQCAIAMFNLHFKCVRWLFLGLRFLRSSFSFNYSLELIARSFRSCGVQCLSLRWSLSWRRLEDFSFHSPRWA